MSIKNGDIPAMSLTVNDSRNDIDVLYVDYNDTHGDFEITVAYDGGKDSEMTCFISRIDAKRLAGALLAQLEEKGE